jgi:type I restriction enzyme R subunit
MAIGGERAAVQNPFICYADEVGWTYLPAEEALRLRRGEEGLTLYEIAVAQLQALNPGVVDLNRAEEVLRRLTIVPPNIEGNLQVWEHLKGLRTVDVHEEKRARNIRLLDPDRPERNTFHVTDELAYSNGRHRIRGDVAFFINGLPLLIVETKAAHKVEGIAEALDQIRRYHREGPELLALLQVHALTHLVQFYYGPTWNLSRKALFNWKTEVRAGLRPHLSEDLKTDVEAGLRPAPTEATSTERQVDYETLVKYFVHPRRMLRLLTDYILFTRKDDELSKVILRPHQMRAVERVLGRVSDTGKLRGLIWHTQGSGKTYTMITAAQKMLQMPAFENPTVLLLVDRNELEAQLFQNLAAVGIERVEVAGSKRHLRELLEADQRGLIVSMIHKFDDIPPDLITRHNVFVLVDEAHRTTGGDLGTYLMAALPNATFIGFTGTPIDKTAYGKGTFKTFGVDDPETGYLDKYGIRESIQDGTTVPLHYSLAPNELQVDRETLEREFLDLAEAEGVSDVEELNRVLEKAVTLGNMLKNRERVEKVAEFVARHFRETVEPMGYKAFLVGVDRQACALLKDALDRHLPAEYSSVVYSRGHNDPAELARYHLSDQEEKEVRKAFRDPERLPKILIVTEKLLTGFDAPVLYCMYLDKPMRDHVLLQAIARVNRPYEDQNERAKPSGFVLDFVGIFDRLEKALKFDSQDVSGVIEDLDLLRARFVELMAEARDKYLPLVLNREPDKALESALEHFRDPETRQRYYKFFRQLEDLYEILSPDAFLRDYLLDYETLSRLYRILRAAYEAGVSLDREFARKTARLVQEQTRGSPIREPAAIYRIDEDTLEAIEASDDPDTVKVFSLIKALRSSVLEGAVQNPYLISIGDRAEAIVLLFQERQLTTQEALRQLQELVQELQEAERVREEKGLPAEAFAVYWLLDRKKIDGADEIGNAMARAFAQHPHWKASERQARDVRRELYKTLIQAGRTEDVSQLVDHVLKIISGV